MRAIAVGLSVLTMTVFSQGAGHAVGEPMKVVAPSPYADMEGDSYAYPATNARYQQVYVASDFESMPSGFQTITQMAWRPDGDLDSPLITGWGSVTIHLSTTDVNPPNLSRTFADNIGEDEAEVFRGPLVLSTANIGPPGGPKEFDQIIPFNTPFEYDPSEGNLLLDVTWHDVSEPLSVDYVSSAGPYMQTRHTNDPALPTSAEQTSGGPVTQFTFVPEPSTLLLALVALGVVGGSRKWKRAA
jgi:hypothetical protein